MKLIDKEAISIAKVNMQLLMKVAELENELSQFEGFKGLKKNRTVDNALDSYLEVLEDQIKNEKEMRGIR